MKSLRFLLSCACVLCVPSLASADDSVVTWAQHRVEDGLVKPLAKREGGIHFFSRERPPPRERRVRVLDTNEMHDKNGRAFVSFAIDVRFGGDWQKDDVVGCAYRATGNLYVKIGDGYRPAAFLLGKKADPVGGVCESAPQAKS